MDLHAFDVDDDIDLGEVEQPAAEANRLRAEQERRRRERQNAALGLLTEKVEALIPSGGKKRPQVEIFKLATGLLDQMMEHSSAVDIIKECPECNLKYEAARTLASGYRQNQHLAHIPRPTGSPAAAAEADETDYLLSSEPLQQSSAGSDSDTTTASEGGLSPLDDSMEQPDRDVQQPQNM